MAYGSVATESAGNVPDHVPAELVHPLDHWNGADFLADPVHYWDDLRGRFRVFWSPYHGGFWCLTRYDDIHEAFQRADLFSSRYTNIPGREVRLLPISLDPPEHTKYRRLLNKPFAPARIEALGATIRAQAVRLIDDVDGRGECEFMDSFAKPLPTVVFCEMLGLPREELPKFLEWNHVILHVHGSGGGAERQRQANEELAAYLGGLVEQRKADRRDDLISQLIDAEVDGERLTDEEVLGTAHLLFMAGLDTVTAGLAWSWLFLASHPEHRRQILDEPSLIPDAVEELLRYHSFIEDSRTVVSDMEFAGVPMRAGDRIMLPTTAASRDPAAFTAPLSVDFRRDPNRHIAFASGPHRCVGSHLARAELRIAMEAWHARIPDYRLKAGSDVRFHGGAAIGPDYLPLELGVS